MLRRELELLLRVVDFPPTPHILIKIASINKIESSSGQIVRDHKDQEIGSVVTQVEKSRTGRW